MKILFVGPSGSGKSTVEREVSYLLGIPCVISTTDRPMRDKDVNGSSYYFVSTEEFHAMNAAGEFAETTTHQGYNYAAQKCHVPEVCICTVNMEGVPQFIATYGEDNVHVLHFACAESICVERMVGRKDNPETIRDRVEFDRMHFKSNFGRLSGVSCEQTYVAAGRELPVVVHDVLHDIRHMLSEKNIRIGVIV